MPKIVELVEIKSFLILSGIANHNVECLYKIIQEELQKSKYGFNVKIKKSSSCFSNMGIEITNNEEMGKNIKNLFYDFQKDKINYEPRIVEKFIIEVKIKNNLLFLFIDQWQSWKEQKFLRNKYCIEKSDFQIKSPEIVTDPYSYCRIEMEEYSKEQLNSFTTFMDDFLFLF